MRSKSLAVSTLIGFLLISFKAYPWGEGAYGLMPHCGLEVAGGSVSIDEDLDDIAEDNKKIKKKQSDAERIKRKAEKDLDRDREALEKAFGSSGKGEFIFTHMENRTHCSNYKGCTTLKSTGQYSCEGSNENKDNVNDSSTEADPDNIRIGTDSTSPFRNKEWNSYCSQSESGMVHVSEICGQATIKANCSSLINSIRKNLNLKDLKEKEIEKAKLDLEHNKEKRKALIDDHKEEVREANEEAIEGGCPTCAIIGNRAYQPRRPDKWEMLGGVMSAAVGGLAGYFGAKHMTNVNAQLGFPTNPAAGFGWPMGMMMGAMGLYGAITGGMNGGFGCNGGIGGSFGPGGLMGYPFGMYPGMPGGGMYLGMGGPFGMMNPLAMLGGMGMPGMGLGGGFGMPGMGLGGGFGMPGIGLGGMMGMPGLGLGGGFGMPGMGLGLGGGFGMPGMGLGGGFGMPGMGLGGGFGMPGMGMDGGLGGFQMQQQMMQMQMQQSQIYMEQQRRMQEGMMARQRVVSGIQQEIYSALYRLQQAQMGIGLGVDLTMPAPPPGHGYYPPPGGGGYGQYGVPPYPYAPGSPNCPPGAYCPPGGFGYQPTSVPVPGAPIPPPPGGYLPPPGGIGPGQPGPYNPNGPVYPQRGPGAPPVR